MEQTAERRREPRLAINAEVFAQTSGDSLGHTADMNAQGMMLVGKHEFSIGEEIRISIDVPNGKSEQFRTSLTAQCRWCEQHPGTSFKNSGFKFIYPSPFDSEYIETLLLAMHK